MPERVKVLCRNTDFDEVLNDALRSLFRQRQIETCRTARVGVPDNGNLELLTLLKDAREEMEHWLTGRDQCCTARLEIDRSAAGHRVESSRTIRTRHARE